MPRLNKMHRLLALLLLTTPLFQTIPIGDVFARAATPQTAPAELVNTIKSLDAVANQRDLDAVMQFYQPDFTHGDGLNKEKLRQSIESLWKRYSKTQYTTELISWDRTEQGYKAETVTTINGTRLDGNTNFNLTAKLTSNQIYRERGGKWQVASQSILSENSSLTSGEKPPSVELRMPSKIGVGRQYSLDAIVLEPLGSSLLLGAVVEESVKPENYIKETTVNLEALKSGGVFKIGQAPYSTGDRWVSVVLVRENGITITGQRLRVSKDGVGNQYRSLPESGSSPSRIRPTDRQT